jgi:tetratricopeptide (TPR) repeat protein
MRWAVAGSPWGRRVLLAAVLALAASVASAQHPDTPPADPQGQAPVPPPRERPEPLPEPLREYLSVVLAHRKGRASDAVKEIRRWPEERLATSLRLLKRQGVSPCPGGPDEIGLDTMQGAILLHLDAGFVAVAETRFVEGNLHCRFAERVLEQARRVHDGWRDAGFPPGCLAPPPISDRDFDLLVATGLLGVGDPRGAAPYAERGVRRDQNDAPVLLVAGCVKESQSNLDRHWGRESQARQALGEAERLFQRSSERDPSLAEARLRFGRAMSLRGWTKEAEPILSELTRTAPDARQRHLAALFLGRAHERRKRFAEAEEAFRLAVEILPQAQASRVALAHLLDRRGDLDLARSILRPALEAPCSRAVGDDPWVDYLFGPFWIGFDMFRAAWRRVAVP